MPALRGMLAARTLTRQTVGTFLGAEAMFYAMWWVTRVPRTTYYAKPVHG